MAKAEAEFQARMDDEARETAVRLINRHVTSDGRILDMF